jgi:hypothetical protein
LFFVAFKIIFMTYQKLTSLARTASFSRLIALATLLLMIAGCGSEQPSDPNRATVSGSVTFDGKPLPGGVITFALADGNIASTVSINQGQYSTSRVPIGLNQVMIETDSLRFGAPQLHTPIPAKYSDPSQSGFEVDIKPGANENVNFEMSK